MIYLVETAKNTFEIEEKMELIVTNIYLIFKYMKNFISDIQ